MGELSWTATISDPGYAYLTGISDLEFFETANGTVLYSLGLAQHGLTAFSIGPNGLTSVSQQVALLPRTSLAPLDLVMAELSGGDFLWVEPWRDTGLLSYSLSGSGGIGDFLSIAGDPLLEPGLTHATLMTPGGNETVFGGLWQGSGVVRLTLDNGGNPQNATLVAGMADEDVAAMAGATINGEDFLFTASGSSPRLSAWQVNANGTTSLVDRMTAAEGLAISQASAMEFLQIGSENFLILTASGTSSVSVVKVSDTGTLSFSDQVTDSASTRFQSLSTLATTVHDGRGFIAVGGADDGVTLMEILPGGRLIHVASVADTQAMTLSNVTAASLHADDDMLHLFVGGSENGVTQLAFELGAAGISLDGLSGTHSGTADADRLAAGDTGAILYGGAGDDILLDGAGEDRLFGQAGHDTFILSPDDSIDRIFGYEHGIDQIDLSGYDGLNSLAGVEFYSRSDGGEFRFNGDRLLIQTNDLSRLNAIDFQHEDILPLDRVFYNPITEQAPGITRTGTMNPDVLAGTASDDILYGRREDDTLRGFAGNDRLIGEPGADLLIGGTGDDFLRGHVGNDDLRGNAGHDILLGDRGHDILYGHGGDDILRGHPGADQLYGGEGNDLLDGGVGFDKLYGQGGEDVFVFRAGYHTDKIFGFTDEVDRLQLDDNLWGGGMNVAQVIEAYAIEYANRVVFDFGGPTRAVLVGVTDVWSIADDIDIV